MKEVFVNALTPSETVTSQFLVTFKEIRQKKTGEPYLNLTLADRTGEIEAKMWDNVEEVLAAFERDDFVKAKGLVQLYQNKLQFTVHKIRRLEDREVSPGDFFPCSTRDPEEMFVELRGIIASVGNPHLRALLESIFSDAQTVELYKKAPAAKNIHHACLGGLLEHVLSLCALSRMTAAHYRDVDLDLLLVAAMLHDIGKIEELSYERSFSYTTAGQLVGHIVIGLQLVGRHLATIPDFPPKLRLLVEHMILSHHGSLEFGSPKAPVFLEALLFHHLDNLDSKVEAMRTAIERDRHPDSEFTGWIPALERTVLKKSRFLQEAPLSGAAPELVRQPEAAPDPTATPGAPPLPKPSAPTSQRPAPMSPFGEKLQAILNLDK